MNIGKIKLSRVEKLKPLLISTANSIVNKYPNRFEIERLEIYIKGKYIGDRVFLADKETGLTRGIKE